MSNQSARYIIATMLFIGLGPGLGESLFAQGSPAITRAEPQRMHPVGTNSHDSIDGHFARSPSRTDSRVAVFQPVGPDQPLSLRRSEQTAVNTMPLSLDERGEGPPSGSDQAQAERDAVLFDNAAKGQDAEDAVTQRQSVDYWNPIEDGQPGAAGSWEVKFDAGWKTFSGQRDPFLLTSQVQYTPEGGHFFRNMKIGVAVPVTMGLGGVDGNGDAVLEWKQRWVAEEGAMPTLATVIDLRLPTGYQSSGIDGTLTGVIAKDFGPGTMIFNGFAKTANGDNLDELRHFQWGFRAGYKWRISDSFALIGDYLHQSSEEEGHSNVNSLQLSGEYHVNEHMTIGPGISIGLDDNEETPNFGAGVRILFSF